ncbi:GNAT family N-acetyltransferase [Steroidobacter sp. S1-65]|uniref:GNAT family N-acetyltransferase n=1 Tax=Steroidobacter gossypii TaxID=2805490 RepID=A0ABS1X4E0_9GAMM|nr:GNAT family N-acetyltransferase [Steroidobacter gossypii]MBM0108082.1 GNAT family N-acetyltransferase [Steroidobacter gossypii]
MIRPALASDAPQLLSLMRGLARFEGYDDRFAVTVEALLERGFAAERPPEFTAWVAELDGSLVGYAVIYVIPYTFDLRPTVVLKELFIDEAARGRNFGHGLMNAVVEHARSLNARLLRWQVLPDNTAARNFYRQHGGAVDSDWENWCIDLDR